MSVEMRTYDNEHGDPVVEEGLPTERLAAMLVDHLLSDKAKAVMHKDGWRT